MADLFGAASRGVDPQTGKYLTKQQRIAMFRASRGMGGGVGGGGTGARAAANPQTAIVAVNRLTQTVQQVQQSYQQTASTVAEQVVQNRQNIQNLANNVAESREQQAKNIVDETRAEQRRRENYLRNAAEGLLEGVGKATKSVLNGIGNTAKKVVEPARGLFQRILNAIGLLLGAWTIDNLPEIIDRIKNFVDVDLPKLGSEIGNFASNFRGVASILDIAFGGIKNFLTRLALRAVAVGEVIFQKATQIAAKIFNKIKTFLGRVINGLIQRIKNLGKGIADKIRGVKPKPEVPKPSPETPKPSPETPKPGKPKPKPKNLFQKFKDFITGGGSDKVKGTKQAAEAAQTAGETAIDPKQSKGLKKFINDLTNAVVKDPLAVKNGVQPSVLRKALGAISKIPFIGFFIDTLLNLSEGQDLLQAAVRGFASNLAGAVGWKAGAGAGALFGQILIPIPGLGGIIGGIVGGVIGSAAAGAVGDTVAKEALKFVNYPVLERNNTEEGTPMVSMPSTGTSDSNNYQPGTQETFDFNVSKGMANATQGLSTPENLRKAASSTKIDFLNLGDEAIPFSLGLEQKNNNYVESPQEFPKISTSDPTTSLYKTLAAKAYQLIF